MRARTSPATWSTRRLACKRPLRWGGVLVGEATDRATRGAVRYEELEQVTAKGKAAPLRVWRALAIRPLAAVMERGTATPFVGRELERGVLEQAFRRALAQSSAQLVTIVGEP